MSATTKIIIPVLPILTVITACVVAAKAMGVLTCSWAMATILLWAPPLAVLAVLVAAAAVVGLGLFAIAVFAVASVWAAGIGSWVGKRL